MRTSVFCMLLAALSLLASFPAAALPEVVDRDSCSPTESTLCLNQGRFRVEATWKDYQGQSGIGRRVQHGSADSGLLWFFSSDNWEVLIKVLDGCQVNNRFWVFAAATTDVEYQLKVTDTRTGASKTYRNPLGQRAAAITDIEAFQTCSGAVSGQNSTSLLALPAGFSAAAAPTLGAAIEPVTAACVPSATVLCLNQGRFQVEVNWNDFSENSGSAQRVAAAGSVNSGLFWFFSASNWEMLVKVLDGCSLNNRFWVFSAATTNVAYTLKVTDTTTGLSRYYTNQAGNSAPAITDTEAFATCSVDPSLPPDPGDAGNASVAGIDTDRDGLRDDVQRYVALAYAGKPEIIRAVRQKAKALQDSVVNASSSQSSFENAVKDLRAAECLFARGGEDAAQDFLALDAVVINTPARFDRYRTHLRNLAGQTFPSRPPEEWAASCAVAAATLTEPEGGGALNSTVSPATSGCTSGLTSVYYANGIRNTFAEAEASLLVLRLRGRGSIPTEEYTQTSFALAYNPTDGLLRDLREAVNQALAMSPSRFLRILYGLEVMPAAYREALIEFERRTAQNLVIDNSVVDNHVAGYRRDIFEGRKVIVVAHSQGNFFANAAWLSMSNQERRSFGLISVANPASVTGDSGPEINLLTDRIIEAIRGPAAATVENGFLFYFVDWPLGHNFIKAYMANGRNSETMIMNRWKALLTSLTQPDDQAGDGIITVTLTWGDQPDVDLHTFEPNGFHVYYRQPFGPSGYLDVDDVNGRGPEHYFVKCEDLETGTYRIGVNYFSGSGTEIANIQIKAGILARNIRRTLTQALGSSGDANPRAVGNIVVTGSAETGYDFQINEGN